MIEDFNEKRLGLEDKWGIQNITKLYLAGDFVARILAADISIYKPGTSIGNKTPEAQKKISSMTSVLWKFCPFILDEEKDKLKRYFSNIKKLFEKNRNKVWKTAKTEYVDDHLKNCQDYIEHAILDENPELFKETPQLKKFLKAADKSKVPYINIESNKFLMDPNNYSLIPEDGYNNFKSLQRNVRHWKNGLIKAVPLVQKELKMKQADALAYILNIEGTHLASIYSQNNDTGQDILTDPLKIIAFQSLDDFEGYSLKKFLGFSLLSTQDKKDVLSALKKTFSKSARYHFASISSLLSPKQDTKENWIDLIGFFKTIVIDKKVADDAYNEHTIDNIIGKSMYHFPFYSENPDKDLYKKIKDLNMADKKSF